jgi:pimeloyl-ACP methyl ester carboxylesterase
VQSLDPAAPVRLYYEERGAGQPVFLLHGLFGSSTNWRSFAKRLADGFRVISVDLRNHGRSPHANRHDYPALVADLLALLGDLRISSTALVGHSMGGKAAMEVALTHPERVDSVAVLDIAPRAYPADRVVLDALLSVDLEHARTRNEVDTALARTLADPALRAFLLMGLTRSEDGGFRWKFNLHAIADDYQAISGPVSANRYEGRALFLRGERSRYIEPTDEPEIRTRFPHARIEVVRHTGHWLHADAPAQTFRAIRGFLEQADDGRF